MIEIWIPVAFVFGVIGSALLFRPIRVERDALKSEIPAIRSRNKDVETELERTSWSLGGRMRDKKQGAIYIMPPGQENEASCDEARLGWMDCADKAAKALRAAGLHSIADTTYVLNVPAEQFGAQTMKPPSVADARKMSSP